MFTGLIREIALVRSFGGESLRLGAAHRPQLGDSIAVNGACLTVTAIESGGFSVELSHETRAVIAVENLRDRVHIEPAMKLGDRFEGHIVQGHIDAIGTIAELKQHGKTRDLIIKAPSEKMRLFAEKGSVAIDGVSLTINEALNDSFRLTLIGQTLGHTLFESYKVGRRVNIETDLFARYTARLLNGANDWNAIDRAMACY
ncbi:riboflavin synthase subunit alpha [Campylobacterota bacterium]|nr:riboflavin synthase subunit alpha [Campylobacterota bacterium]